MHNPKEYQRNIPINEYHSTVSPRLKDSEDYFLWRHIAVKIEISMRLDKLF